MSRPPVYSWGVRKRRGHPHHFLMSFQRMARSRCGIKPSLPLVPSVARNFDLQKSEGMLRKVRPHSREHPASHMVYPRDQLRRVGTLALSPLMFSFLPSSLDPVLHQTWVSHILVPAPIPSSVLVEPGDALVGSSWMRTGATGLMAPGILKALGAGSPQVLPCLLSTWCSGSNRTWTTSSSGSPRR